MNFWQKCPINQALMRLCDCNGNVNDNKKIDHIINRTGYRHGNKYSMSQ